MDISTALWAAAIGAGASLATIALFGAVAGRRFRNRARRRGFGGPAWAHAHAGHGGRCAGHAKFAMAGGHGSHGRCARRGDASDAPATDADASVTEQAEA